MSKAPYSPVLHICPGFLDGLNGLESGRKKGLRRPAQAWDDACTLRAARQNFPQPSNLLSPDTPAKPFKPYAL